MFGIVGKIERAERAQNGQNDPERAERANVTRLLNIVIMSNTHEIQNVLPSGVN